MFQREKEIERGGKSTLKTTEVKTIIHFGGNKYFVVMLPRKLIDASQLDNELRNLLS